MARTATSRVVLASNCSVYDWSKVGGSLDEDAPTLDPTALGAYDGYAQAKTLQERLAPSSPRATAGRSRCCARRCCGATESGASS